MDLKQLIRTIPDFPKPGIQFKDIESISENPAAYRYVIEALAECCEAHRVQKLMALDARGFLFGGAVAFNQDLPLVMARKQGKLAGECVSEKYALEYGEAEIELQRTAIEAGERIMIVDDLLATGGTARAASRLINRLGGELIVYAFVIELNDLGGRQHLDDAEVVSLVQF